MKAHKQTTMTVRILIFSIGIMLSCNAFAKKNEDKKHVTQAELQTAIEEIELLPGPQGDQGIQGIKGDKGEQGIQGIKGDKGDQGIQGVKGDKGDQGIQGIKGDQGELGIQGVKGDQGEQGIQGIKGDQGELGIQGVKGDQGEQGIQGIKGDKGEQGIQGIKGDQGDQGIQGVKGDKGEQGIQGVKGDKGDTGTKGDAGGIVQYKGAAPIALNSIQRLVIDATAGDFTLGLGSNVTPVALIFNDSALNVELELQALVELEFILEDANRDVKVSKEGNGVYHITFIGELASEAIDLLTVDSTNLTGGTGGTIATAEEIGLTEGLNTGDLLEWNGSNWVATPPRLQDLQPIDNMQPFQTVNFIIALQGTFPSRNSSDPFIAEIIMFGGNFAPRGWAFCDGQLLPISSNTALFSILGTTYGGDGRTTFGLPDLRGRVPLHAGSGPGLRPRRLGERGGTETFDLPPL